MRISTDFVAAVITGALTAAGATGTARAGNSTLQINDSFPAAVSVYTTGGTKGPGGATATVRGSGHDDLPFTTAAWLGLGTWAGVGLVRSGLESRL